MKKIISLTFILFSLNVFADTAAVVSRVTEANATAGQMVEILNQIFIKKGYSSFTQVPTGGHEESATVTVTDTTVTPNTTSTFITRIVFSSSSVSIPTSPAGWPNAGQTYTNKVTIYVDGCGGGVAGNIACAVIDFDSSLQRGHAVITSNGTFGFALSGQPDMLGNSTAGNHNATLCDTILDGWLKLNSAGNCSARTEIMNSLLEVYYDNSIAGNSLISSKMLDRHVAGADPTNPDKQFILDYNKTRTPASIIDTTTVLNTDLSAFGVDSPATLFGLREPI